MKTYSQKHKRQVINKLLSNGSDPLDSKESKECLSHCVLPSFCIDVYSSITLQEYFKYMDQRTEAEESTDFNISFNMDNAAFDDIDNGSGEVSRVLYAIADSFSDGNTDGFIYDINGNKVGKWSA